jgi:hypothetical protein
MNEPQNTSMKQASLRSNYGDGFDLDALLHPASAFQTPTQVLNDPDLTLNEKRAILASWASDACAIEAAPSLRRGSDGRVVPFDDIMEALRSLDRQQAATADASRYRRATRWTRMARGGRNGRDDQDPPLF